MIDIMFWIEIAAVVFGLLSVYLTTKQNIWCWPTGIAMVVLYVIIFFNARLYSDMIENFIYIPLQIFGWYYWMYGGKNKTDVKVTTFSAEKRVFIVALIIIITFVVGFVMDNYTNADLAYIDALTTVMSLTAQVIMSMKKLENWVLWITVDVMALFVYTIKGLYMTTGLYAVFLILAISGFIKWRKSMLSKQKQEVMKWKEPAVAEPRA